MAKKTYTQLKETIAALEREAENTRLAELFDVVARIKSAISAYGITNADLFGGSSTKAVRGAKKVGSGKSKSANPTAKYADGNGGEWVGRGPRPRWLRDALAAGSSLKDFAVNGAAATVDAGGPSPASTKKKGLKKKATQAVPKATYTDGAGHNWSGRGPRPRWLKDAVAGGKSLDELRA